jgi:hypothetical protein
MVTNVVISASVPYAPLSPPNAWICLVLFVRIGTFQWVMANLNRKSAAISDCAPNVSSPPFPAPGDRDAVRFS